MKINTHDEEPMELNLIALIDCVLFLLFFFLVATSLKKIDRELPLNLPDSAAAVAGPQHNDALVISIDATGGTYIGGAPASTGMLHDRLKEAGKSNPGQAIRIEGDRAAPFEAVVHILDLCDFEGLKNVKIRARDAK